MIDGYLIPQFGDVPVGKPHYESVYLTATNPTDGSAIWIRYTVGKPAGSTPKGSVWFTRFAASGPRAAKGSAAVGSTSSEVVVVDGLGSIGAAGATGALEVPGLSVAWSLTFEPVSEPMSHLRRRWMYRSPIPKTKSTSPYPDMRVSGSVTLDGETLALDGWRGMLGHNWGSEHALRWIWLRGAGFDADPDAWLDVVIGRIKVGPVTLPWFANGLLSVDGERHRMGGAYRLPSIAERVDGCDIGLRSRSRPAGWCLSRPPRDLGLDSMR